MSIENVTLPSKPNGPNRLTWGVDEASAASGLSPRRLWAAIADGELESVVVGRRRLIPDSALRRFLGLQESV